MRRRNRRGVFLALGSLFLVLSGIVFVGALYHGNGGEIIVEKHEIPKIMITLNDVSLEEIHEGGRDKKYPNNILTLVNNGEEHAWSAVELKGRGNSTWGMKKKSYRVKFDKRTELLGLGKSKKWALIANYIDDSQLRNDVAFRVNEMLDDSFMLRGDYVDLVIDDEDLGLYYLTRTIAISKDVVRLSEPAGILMELDNLYCEGEDETFLSGNGDCLVFKDIVSYDEKEKSINAFLEKYNNLEEAIRLEDYDEVKNNIDVNSFANYFLISEFTNNPDAYSSSWWMYMDGFEDVIHVGPAWDFDYALGNKNWEHPDSEMDFHNPMLPMVRKDEYDYKRSSDEYSSISQMMYDLMGFSEFRELVESIYSDRLMGKKDEIISYIRNKSEIIRDEAIKDSRIWEKNDFDEEVDYLMWWIENRFRMMDAEYGTKLIIIDAANEI